MPADALPTEVVVGLDVGTTATKAVAFGLGSSWRHVVVREYPLLEPSPGWQVQDLGTVLAAVCDALAECVAATAGARVLAVSVSTAMHGLVALDEHRRPLTPLVTWADSRAAGEARALRASGRAAELHRRSGTPVHPMSPLTKLMWFARHEPELCARTRWWAGLKDCVLERLTGTLVTELSSASATGLLDLSTRDWDPLALELAGVQRSQLPDVLPTTSVLPLAEQIAARTGLPAGTPVVVGAADGPLGNLGTGAMSPGSASLSLGTSGAVRMVVPRPVVDPGGGLFCYALTDRHWVVGGAVSNGGSVVRWAGTALTPDLDATTDADGADEALLALASSVPAGSDGLVMLPYLFAERAPLWDPDLPGAYLGLRRQHTRAHLARAAVEGVCLQLSTIVDRLERIQPVHTLRVTGGAFRSPLWREVMAAVLARPLRPGADAEGSALGAAALGLHALGRPARLEDAVDLLAGPRGDDGTVVAAPDLVVLYDGVRRRIPALIAALGDVGRLHAPAPPRTELAD